MALLSVALVPPSPATGRGDTATGLWPSTFAAQQVAADCGQWRLDRNDFCVANDSRNGLEVGVRFVTSRELQITGVRIYRVDTGPVKASLWSSDGTLLARGAFAASTGNTWQDMRFADPVTVVPGETYVASYFTPATKYAFRHGYFAGSGRTVGPVTALRSVDGGPNGVYCYDDAVCGSFPVRGYRDSTYWVTPLWQAAADEPTSSPTPTPTETATGTPTSTPAATPSGSETSPDGATADVQPPRVVDTTPAGALRVDVGVAVTVKFSEPMLRSALTGTTVRLLRHTNGRPVRTRVAYDAQRRRAVLDPRSRLRPATRYRVVVTSGVRDVAGNRLDQNPSRTGLQQSSWTFRTR